MSDHLTFLALGLGSILPMCHASSVLRSKVEPARKELSRAQTYRATLQGQPGYRAPEEIVGYISAVKFRGGTTTVVIWLAGGGLLGFLWFRYT